MDLLLDVLMIAAGLRLFHIINVSWAIILIPMGAIVAFVFIAVGPLNFFHWWSGKIQMDYYNRKGR
jgi:hypothetical protein